MSEPGGSLVMLTESIQSVRGKSRKDKEIGESSRSGAVRSTGAATWSAVEGVSPARAGDDRSSEKMIDDIIMCRRITVTLHFYLKCRRAT
jgi:hypothetical protein